MKSGELSTKDIKKLAIAILATFFPVILLCLFKLVPVVEWVGIVSICICLVSVVLPVVLTSIDRGQKVCILVLLLTIFVTCVSVLSILGDRTPCALQGEVVVPIEIRCYPDDV